jgi:hypothetical protein
MQSGAVSKEQQVGSIVDRRSVYQSDLVDPQ